MLAELLNYTTKADAIVIEQLNLPTVDVPEANKLFSHVLTAQHIWAKRILKEKPAKGVWEEQDKSTFKALSEENARLFELILKNASLSEVIHYTNSAGEEFESAVQDILLHVGNHSTYHRGQIVSMLKKAGHVPPVTDYIMLKRTNQL